MAKQTTKQQESKSGKPKKKREDTNNVEIQPRVRKKGRQAAFNKHSQLRERVVFMLMDMLSFSVNKNARLRLGQEPEDLDNIPQYFNSNYFTLEQSRCLTELPMKSTVEFATLGEAFQAFMAECGKANGGEICTSSEMAPFLCNALRFPCDIHEDKELKRKYKEFDATWKSNNRKKKKTKDKLP